MGDLDVMVRGEERRRRAAAIKVGVVCIEGI